MHKPNTSPADGLQPQPKLWKNAQFLSLFGGNTALFFGFSATILVRSLITWELTGDEMSLALINLVTAAGIFFVSFFSGVIIDRVERKRLLLCAHSLILLGESTAFFLYLRGALTFDVLLLLTAAMSFTFPFVMPTRTTMLVPAVGKVRLAKATAIMSSSISLARMVSPALAGFLADSYGLKYAYMFMVSLYALSLLFVIALEPNHPEKKLKTSFFNELKMGFVYIYTNKPLAACMVFALFPMLVVIPLQNLLVVFVDTVWHAGGGGLGFLMAAMGVGGMLGSVIAARVKSVGIVKPVFCGTLLLALCLVVFSHAPNLWLGAIVMVAVYTCSVTTQTLVQTAIQLMTDDNIRGRVTTVSLMSYGLAPLGTLPLAYLTQKIGAPWAITFGAVFIVAGTLYMWFNVQSFRDIDKQTHKYRSKAATESPQEHSDTIL